MNLTALIKELKEKAEAATPGPWEFICSQDEQRGYILADKEWCEDMAANVFRKTIANISTGPAQSNGVYIALCSLENILALVKALEEAKELAFQIEHLAFKRGETVNLEKAVFRLETCRDLACAFLDKHFGERKE